MATRTYEIKGKYTDGTDYTAGTFTVSDGTNGTNGTNGKDGADGVGFYYTTDATTGTSGIYTLLSQIMPSGIKVDDFLVNANGIVCQVTEISGTNVFAQYLTSIKGATGATGSPGATGKGIASVQVVEV